MSGDTIALGLACPSLLRDAAFIAGVWRSARETIAVINPADGTLVGEVPDMGEAGATDAIDAAEAAQPGWAALTGKARGAILRRWADLILLHRVDLARLLTAEQGKPLSEAESEVSSTAAFFEWFAEEARRINGELLTPHQADRRLIVRRQPVGVVAAITPWNFPLAMIARKAAPRARSGMCHSAETVRTDPAVGAGAGPARRGGGRTCRGV